MKIDFLSATDGTALTKTYTELAPGKYDVKTYPNVLNFTSHSREIYSIQDFYDNLTTHAAEGLCLLKGLVKVPLKNESRAGHTDAHASTAWLCLDIDIPLDLSPGEFLDQLDPAFQNVSYIAHASASHGIKSSLSKWRGHIYILLESPVSPKMLKPWLIDRNLELNFLAERLELSAGGFALRYPLDITTCQNDKLIYIAPPTCIGFNDPVNNRYEVVIREFERARFKPSVKAGVVQNLVNKVIIRLRADSGLEARKAKLKKHDSGVEILQNPDAVTVTGTYEARGFVYLNLDGGDSWAYYFRPEHPEILRNFKGEPCMYVEDVDRDIWNEYNKLYVADSVTIKFTPFICRSSANDSYYNGRYYPETETVILEPTSSKVKLKDFLAQYGKEMEESYVSDWDVTFDPTQTKVIDFDRQWVNTYKQSTYIKNAEVKDNVFLPITISRILDSLCGTGEIKDHFLNWLAGIFQYRHKSGTAWIFQGVPGTGKGLFFTSILQPLLGVEQCHETTMERFEDQFNGYLESNIALFIDEANVRDSRNGDRMLNKLKNLITEDNIVLREMRQNPKQITNYSNLIFASNELGSIPLDDADRRFNVAPRQEIKLEITTEEIEGIKDELRDFSNYLKSYEVDVPKTREIIITEAREQLILAGRTTVATFFANIRHANLDYFVQFLRDDTPADFSGLQYVTCKKIVLSWIDNVGVPATVLRDDIHAVYDYLQGTSRTMGPAKFSRMCTMNGINIKPASLEGRSVRGLPSHVWELTEQLSEEQMTELKETTNVVPIR